MKVSIYYKMCIGGVVEVYTKNKNRIVASLKAIAKQVYIYVVNVVLDIYPLLSIR